MSEPTTWTDSNEHTLDMIRLNSVNLSERHYTKYQIYKNRMKMVKYPVLGLSVVNTYAVLGMTQYVDQHYVTVGSAILSCLIAAIILADILSNNQKKLEGELARYIEYKDIGRQIYETLSLDRLERKVDPQTFLNMKYKAYDALSETNNRIQKFKDVVLTEAENFMSMPLLNKDDPLVQKLHRHWGILSQPVTLRLKGRKKTTDIESQVVQTEEPEKELEMTSIYEKSDPETSWVANFFQNPFKGLLTRSKSEEGEGEADGKGEAGAKAEGEGEGDGKAKPESESPVAEEKTPEQKAEDAAAPVTAKDYEVKEVAKPSEPTSPESKKFGMNFMAK